jgi:hypothetical protein
VVVEVVLIVMMIDVDDEKGVLAVVCQWVWVDFGDQVHLISFITDHTILDITSWVVDVDVNDSSSAIQTNLVSLNQYSHMYLVMVIPMVMSNPVVYH